MMTKEDIKNSPEYQAAHIAYTNGLCRNYDLIEMAHYMFLAGVKFGKTGEMPKSEIDKYI